MNRKFIVTIEETISQNFEVCAEDENEAEKIAREKYDCAEFVLEPGNLILKKMFVQDESCENKNGWIEF